MPRKSSSGKVNALCQLAPSWQQLPKWEKAKTLECVCGRRRREWLEVIEKTATARSLGKSKENCWFSYQTKMPALAQKNHHRRRFAIYRRHSIQWDCMQIHIDRHTNKHTYIYIYIVWYIYILVLAICLCAFDAQHKLTLQTFCGLKSAASGTLSMASKCAMPALPLPLSQACLRCGKYSIKQL